MSIVDAMKMKLMAWSGVLVASFVRSATRCDVGHEIGDAHGQIVVRFGKYQRALNVDMQVLPDTEHHSEMRKIRLLLESLL